LATKIWLHGLEEKCNILNHLDVPIYGQYIGNCFAIIYASSEQEVINKVSIVQFDECVIEWNASASQPFLDKREFHGSAFTQWMSNAAPLSGK
jgi:hypothetical protein